MVDRRQLLFAVGTAATGLAVAGWADYRPMGSMADYVADIARLRASRPVDPAAPDLIRFATLVTTGGRPR